MVEMIGKYPYNIFSEKSEEVLARLLSHDNIASELENLKEHHKTTYEHSLRVGMLAIDIGLENERRDDEIAVLGVAGLLHDLGKKDLSLDILDKEGALTEEERKRVKEHVRQSIRALEGAGFERARKIVAGHHEYQKNPYPRKGEDRRSGERAEEGDRRDAGDAIAFLSQIVAISDTLDALASARSYKDALSKEAIEDIMRKEFTGSDTLIEQALRRID